MRAATRTRYGYDSIAVEEVPKPELVDDGVLVRVRATSVNPADWYAMTGTPYVARPQVGLLKPKSPLFGVDFAGTVEAMGADFSGLAPGDEVFGGRSGAYAEYVVVRNAVVPKPANIGFEETAAVGTAAITALQGLRDKGELQPGQRVLINGASGGVGTFAVQIAKALGAEVTGVCSTGNVDLVRSLGADHVVDYTKDDFTRGDRRYDLVLDVAGSRSFRELRRVLEPGATVVIVGAPKGNRVTGPLGRIVLNRVSALGSGHKAGFFLAQFNRPDMEHLRELIEAGKVTPVIDRRYQGLDQISDALRYLGEGHARGKVVVAV